jgi:hypothetical protein
MLRFTRSRFAQFWVGFYYSMPAQLLLSQFRSHKSLLAFWAILFLILNRVILADFGGAYLLLEPEYLNEVDFWGMFFLGMGLAIFMLAYQMTSYILDGYRFIFLTLDRQPFLRFCINNSLIPVLFWGNYTWKFLQEHNEFPQYASQSSLVLLIGAYLGAVFVSLLAFWYFFSRAESIIRLLGQGLINEIQPRRAFIRTARRSLSLAVRVDWFFTTPWSLRPVPTNLRGDLRKIVTILNRNHSTALTAELFLLGVLLVIGIFHDYPHFRIPSGASFLILFSFFIMLVGALTYWFRQIGPLSTLVLFVGFYYLNQLEGFVGKNYAYGLDYNQPPAGYVLDSIHQLTNPQLVTQDSLHTIQRLENWKRKLVSRYPQREKPLLVFLCTTGGGVRSATWTVKSLQLTDQLTNNAFSDHVFQITGASGGMMGAAYYRELLIQKLKNPNFDLTDQRFVENIAKDLLNPIILNLTSNLLLPNRRFQDGSNRYEEDRGYAMELQYAENIQAIFDKRLKDYAELEFEARIPAMLFTPVIINDGRQLLISPQPASYLCHPDSFTYGYKNENSLIEFQRLFRHHNPLNLRFTTAIRMNATFPTILPFIELPTKPQVQVVDAGLLDNFGTFTLARFIKYFRNWINTNTSGVLVLQLRDSKRENEVQESNQRTILSKAFGLGSTLGTYTESKDLTADLFVSLTRGYVQVPFHYQELQYIPSNLSNEASLSFHLTQREKEDVLQAIRHPENQQVLRNLQALLRR